MIYYRERGSVKRQFKALGHAIVELAVLKFAGLNNGLETQGRAAAARVPRPSNSLFPEGLQLIRCGPPTLGHVICFIQSPSI